MTTLTPSANYCPTHDAPFFEAECPACIADHNAEIDSDIAKLAIRLARILDNSDDFNPSKLQRAIILEILRLCNTYKQGA